MVQPIPSNRVVVGRYGVLVGDEATLSGQLSIVLEICSLHSKEPQCAMLDGWYVTGRYIGDRVLQIQPEDYLRLLLDIETDLTLPYLEPKPPNMSIESIF